MKKATFVLSLILLVALGLAACVPSAPIQAPAPAPTQPPPAKPAPTEAPAVQPAADTPTAAPAGVQHTDIPAEPSGKGVHLGDQTVTAQADQQRAFAGDGYTDGRLERPFNANTMDTYAPFVDITEASFYASDPQWFYATVTLADTDANKALTGKYGLELDLNQDGRGDILILIDHPAAAEWSTDGVQVFKDGNGDVGGARAFVADSSGASGDGYETVLFDKGQGNDPDLAWARVSAANPRSFDVAFKQSLLGGEKTYMVGVVAGTELDPALFDYVDHFTHEQAGAALKSLTAYYPIKAVADMDNTCRQAIGFTTSSNIPGACK